MKLNSKLFLASDYSKFLFALVFVTIACSKQASSDDPGRVISQSTTTTGGGDTSGDDTSGDVVRGGDTSDSTTTTGGDGDVIDTGGNGAASGNILLSQYPNSVPSTKVCKNPLNLRNADTLKKFFNWDIVSLEGPVTVCIEQDANPSRCPAGEAKCVGGVDHNVRFRIEYEDNFRFWYYDSAAPLNYAKVLGFSGGSGADSAEILLQDGAGFLMVSGNKTSTGAYDLLFQFADRPSYSAARTYDTANNYTSDSDLRRAATLFDMSVCAKALGGTAVDDNGNPCVSRWVLHYTFFTDLSTAYPVTAITDTALWLQNQASVARSLVTNQYPTQFAAFGINGGTFGRVTVNGL